MSFYSFFAADYERIFPFREEVYRFLQSYAGEEGSRVLDVGCGPGHYCGRFAADGYVAAGIDLDRAMIDEAVRRYPAAGFRCLDMRDVDSVPGSIHCAYSIGNVAAHLRPDELARFLGKVGGMLEPGGSWIMQVMNWDALAGMEAYEFPVRAIGREGGEATFHRAYRFIERGTVLFSVSLKQAGRELFGEEATLYPLTVRNYLDLHRKAGFTMVAICSDFTGKPLAEVPGSGLVMVFRKG